MLNRQKKRVIFCRNTYKGQRFDVD